MATGPLKAQNSPKRLWWGSSLLTVNMEINVDPTEYQVLIFIYAWGETGIIYQREYYKAMVPYMTLDTAESNRYAYIRVNGTKLLVGDVGQTGSVYLKYIYGIKDLR